MNDPFHSIRSVQCTQCGAPLDLHGGHKVRSLICGYCGSLMDAHQDYRLITGYTNAGDRPLSPFKLGMKGSIKGIEFILIGMVEYDAEGDRWLDFQLYSPTHGYAWLSQNKGHYSFSRRIRQIPTPSRIKQFKSKKIVRVKGKQLKLFERYTAKITYVEGELTWIAKRGDSSKVIEAIDPPYGLSYEQNKEALEYSWEEYLDTDSLFAAFGLEAPPQKPSHVHALQPYATQTFWGYMENISPYYFLSSLLILIVLWLFTGSSNVLTYQPPSSTTVTTQAFEISSNSLFKLTLSAQPSKDRAWYEVEILDAQEQPVFSLGNTLTTVDMGQSQHWSEDAGEVRAWLQLDAGQYDLQIRPVPRKFNINLPDHTKASEPPALGLPVMQIDLEQEGFSVRFVAYYMLLTLLLLFIASFKHVSFEARRWED